ncbi:MAG: MBL fold metallo-hydrolase [Candidatus Thorarchaeota archaeon]|jgi:L-ascorbate metabolism protein UlaG (beta-lactamase superfamily)
MTQTKNSKILLGVIIGVIVVSTPIILMLPPVQEPPTEIKVTLLFNASVMIEVEGVRIYIDPYFIPSNHTELPADVILVTHDHFDHYSTLAIRTILTNDTLFVCPETMTEVVERFDGLGVNPGDSFLVGDINITAFHMYLPDYPSQAPSFHPRASNWTSFIIEIDGFTIFHAGDAKYMDEYEELTGKIDVAFLPIYFDPGFGALNESLLPIVEAINVIQPNYTIPTHFNDVNREIFISEYSILIENPSCEILNYPFFSSHTFLIDGDDT